MTVAGVEITHPERVLFPEDGITKLDVVNYYHKVAKKMIPFLTNRAVSLVRSPGGIDEGRFYQKHPSENFPEYIDRIKIKEKDGETNLYIEIDSENDLVYLANLGTIEFHTWLSKVQDLEHPDICIIDFDPDLSDVWKYVIDGIKYLKKEVEELGFESEARVTGGKGVHLVFEYKQKTTWPDAKAFAKSLAQKLVDQDPEHYTLDMSKEKRKGKIFLDYLRNERGSTAVSPYSLRTKPGAPFAKPIPWTEVTYELKPNKFKLKDIV